MISKVLSVLLTVVLTLFTAEGCEKHDVPAGSAGGDSAGNSQPDAGKLEQCLVPGQMDIEFVGYVEMDGLKYGASAYLLDGECDMIDTDGEEWLKVTLVAIDSIGRRIPPVLDASPQASPFAASVTFALPTLYTLEIVVTGNMNRSQVESSETVFVACALIPFGNAKGPVSTKIMDIGAGKGKVDCRVTG